MSRQIDDKVVSMEFDNGQFERNVNKSIGTLDRLKKALNFEGAEKGLESVSKASSKCDFSVLSGAIDSVSNKFSKIEIAGITAVTRLTNSAITASKNIIKSLSTDQLSAGWSKYADKTASVQTIMAATAKDFADTGEQMEYVNSQLDKLNWFTDETSYNFLDMVSNIGKFTSNGVKLDTAVTAMEGISTWAAISGANAGEASRAMYNLSQALATGAVKLIDWKSIENANMATLEFKERVLQAAAATGTLTDNGDGLYTTMKGNEVSATNFNEALSDGWFTSEVLLDTLNQYGGFSNALNDASDSLNMTATEMLEAIDSYKEGTLDIQNIADDTGKSVEELTELFNSLSSEEFELGQRAFRAAQEAKTLEEAISATKDAVSTGWMNTFEIIFGDYEEAKKLWTDVANELYDVFASGAEYRNEMLEAWRDMNGRMYLLQAVENVWQGLLNIIDAVKEAFRSLFPKTNEYDLLRWTLHFNTLSLKFKNWTENIDTLKRSLRGVFAIFGIIKEVLSAVWYIVKQVFGGFTSIAGSAGNASAKLGDWLANLYETIKKGQVFLNVAKKIIEFFKSLPFYIDLGFHAITGMALFEAISKVKAVLLPLFDSIKSIFKGFSNIDMSGANTFGEKIKRIFEPLKPLLDGLLTIIKALGGIVRSLFPVLKTFFSFIGNGIKTIGNGLSKSINSENVANGIVGLLEAGVFVGISALVSKLIKSISGFTKRAKGIMDSVKEMFEGLGDTVESFNKDVKAHTLKTIASSLLMIAAAILILSLIEPDALTMSLMAVSAIMLELGDAIKKLSEIGKIKLSIPATMIALSVSLIMLAVALRLLAKLSVEDILKGTLAISAFTAAIIAISKSLNRNKKEVTRGSGILIAFGIGLIAFAVSLRLIAKLSWDDILRGTAALAAFTVAIIAISKSLNRNKKEVTRGSGILIAFGVGLIAFAVSLRLIAKLSWDDILRGTAALAAFTAAIIAISKSLNRNKKEVTRGSGILIAFGVGLIAFAVSLRLIAKLNWDDILRGSFSIVAFALAFAIVAHSLNGSSKNIAKGSLALIVFSASLLVLAAAMKIMGSLSWDDVLQGIATIAAFSLALVVLTKVLGSSKKIFKVSGLIISFALSLLIVSSAFGKIADALSKLSKLGKTGVLTGVIALASVLALLIAAGYLLKPVVGTFLKFGAALALAGIGAMAFGIGLAVIALNIGAISASLISASVVVGKAIITIIQLLIAALPMILSSLASALDESLSSIIQLVTTVASTALDSIIVLVPKVVEVIVAILTEVANNIEPIVSALLQIFVGIIQGVAENMGPLAQACKGVIDAFLNAVGGMAGLGTLAVELLAMTGIFAELLVMGLIGLAATATLPGIGKNLSKFVESSMLFLTAIQRINPASLIGARALADTVLIMTEAAILDGLTAWLTGGNDFAKFGEELEALAPHIAKFYEETKEVDANNVSVTAEAISTLASLAITLRESLGLVGKSWHIDDFGKELSSFAPLFVQFANNTKGVNGKLVSECAEAIGYLVAAVPNKIPDGYKHLKDFGDELVDFSPVFTSFSNSISGLNSDAVLDASVALGYMIDVARAIPNEGGLWASIAGDNSLSDFASGLDEMAPSLQSFANGMIGLNVDAIRIAKDGLMLMIEVARAIPNEGGLWSAIVGDNTLADFAAGLDAMAPSLQSFADQMVGLRVAAIRLARNGLMLMIEVARAIPNEGGLWAAIVGDNTLAEFADGLDKMAPSLKSFADQMVGLNVEALQLARDGLLSVIDVASAIPKQGGLVSKIAGDSTFEALADGLDVIGPSLSDYSKAVSEMSVDDVLNSMSALRGILRLFSGSEFSGENAISFSSGIFELFSPSNAASIEDAEKVSAPLETVIATLAAISPDLKTYSTSLSGTDFTQMNLASVSLGKLFDALGKIPASFDASSLKIDLESLAPSFATYIEGISGIDSSSFENAIDRLNRIWSIFKKLGSVADNAGEFDDALSKVGESSLNAFLNVFSGFNVTVTAWKAAGQLVNVLAMGIRSKQSTLTDQLKASVLDGVNKINTFEMWKEFYDVGVYFVKGFCSGIKDNTWRIENASKLAASRAIDSWNSSLEIQSPSKASYRSGRHFVQGWVNAVSDYSSYVSNSASSLGEEAVAGLSNSVAHIADMIENGVDTTPTIKPVLDLDNITSGVQQIDSMLGRGRSLHLAASSAYNVNQGIMRLRREQQVNSNSEVVGAIEKLGQNVERTSKNFRRLRVVMDTGQVVGVLASPIDNELGKKAIRSRRGV